MPIIARLQTGMPRAVAAGVRVWGRGSLVAILITLSLALLGEGAPGDLDPTFGVGGKVVTDLSGNNDEAQAVALQPDGNIVVVGHTPNVATGNVVFALARYRPNGSLDLTFGDAGWTTTDFASDESAVAQAVALQPDGNIAAAGYTVDLSSVSAFALARYHPDGSLDPTFGGDGRVTTDFAGTVAFGQVYAVALQADGKIVAAGRIVNASPFLGSTLPRCAIGPTVRWIRPSAAMAG
jgi:uncharacterized delta-60 repeat protein